MKNCNGKLRNYKKKKKNIYLTRCFWSGDLQLRPTRGRYPAGHLVISDTFAILRPLFVNFLVYGFLGGKNGSVGRKKIKNKKISKGPIMSSCRKKLPVHGNSIKK